MDKIKEAQEILGALGLPSSQQNEMSALTLLALCGITKKTPWKNASRTSMSVTKGIMDFFSLNYEKTYAPNTRETVRRQVLHQFVQASIADYNPDNPNLPTNSPKAHYAISEVALKAIRSYGTESWSKEVKKFISLKGALLDTYERRKSINMVPVQLLDGNIVNLSPGKHNIVQAAIIEKFGSKFVPGGILLYLGDTAKKNLIIEKEKLESMNISINDHDKLPDVILFDSLKDKLFLIEAVTSHGPMTPKRVNELIPIFKNCKSTKIYVSAFPDFSEFKKHMSSISWDTEIWIMEHPDHMIHFNGDKFLH